MYFAKSTNGFYDPAINQHLPEDAIEITSELYQLLMNEQAIGKIIAADSNGYPIAVSPPPPTADEMKKLYIEAVQNRLDSFAQSKGYDGIMSACTYVASSIASFANEAQRCVLLRDETWNACYKILTDIEQGKRTIPTIDEMLAELPALTWE